MCAFETKLDTLRLSALDALEEALDEADTPAEKRRCAVAILRIQSRATGCPVPAGQPVRPASDSRTSPPTPPAPERRTSPQPCDLSIHLPALAEASALLTKLSTPRPKSPAAARIAASGAAPFPPSG